MDRNVCRCLEVMAIAFNLRSTGRGPRGFNSRQFYFHATTPSMLFAPIMKCFCHQAVGLQSVSYTHLTLPTIYSV